jgi:hypothetical protein
MAQEQNPIDQAISRALRENLERLQRAADELHQAVNDVVSACASTRPSHALPPMLRAQTAAASLTAMLDVLSRFISSALQPSQRTPFEAELSRLAGISMQSPAEPPVVPPISKKAPQAAFPVPRAAAPPAAVPAPQLEAAQEVAEALESTTTTVSDEGFDLNQLSSEEQELHRRANRVAKVSMQDIKMLRPDQVRLGRENKDICIRLRDDIEKAHKEYDRRFRPIMAHPVDYFYHWMVQILGDGDPKVLGEYPYASHAQHS